MAVLEAALGAGARAATARSSASSREAGVGKSRCASSSSSAAGRAASRCTRRGGVAHGQARFRSCRCSSCSAPTTASPSTTTTRVAREKIAGRLLLLDETLRESCRSSSISSACPTRSARRRRMDPEARQRQLFAVVRRMVQARRAARAGASRSSRTCTGSMPQRRLPRADGRGRRDGTRRLVLLNFRPEYHGRWMQKSYYQQMPLAPLGPEAIRELLDDLLGSDPAPGRPGRRDPRAPAAIRSSPRRSCSADRDRAPSRGTQGAYRLVRPVDTLAVPASVQAVLAARIDRLPEREKQVLQTPSVIGKTFPEAVLERVVAGADRGPCSRRARSPRRSPRSPRPSSSTSRRCIRSASMPSSIR